MLYLHFVNFHIRNVSITEVETFLQEYKYFNETIFVQSLCENVESDCGNIFQNIKIIIICINIVYCNCEMSQFSHCNPTPNSVRFLKTSHIHNCINVKLYL